MKINCVFLSNSYLSSQNFIHEQFVPISLKKRSNKKATAKYLQQIIREV